jgi:hypothetical protein
MLLTKFKEGNRDDSLEPFLTIPNRNPGTIRINMKNAITPIITILLLLRSLPIGIIAIKIKRTKIIGNLTMFLIGYFNELKTIFDKSISYLI